MIRVLIALCAFVSALFFPAWVTIILAIILVTLWQAPEVILLGALFDLLYMPPGGVFFIPMPATLAAIVLVWVMIPIQKRLFMGK